VPVELFLKTLRGIAETAHFSEGHFELASAKDAYRYARCTTDMFYDSNGAAFGIM